MPPSWHLIVQSHQFKHQNTVLNQFKDGNNKKNQNDVIDVTVCNHTLRSAIRLENPLKTDRLLNIGFKNTSFKYKNE